MPVDFQQIRKQVGVMGENAPSHFQEADDRLKSALTVFNDVADQPDQIRGRIEKAVTAEPGLRCAVPGEEPIQNVVPLPPAAPARVILAADGSQINPSRHEAADFGVINLGALTLVQGMPPRESVESRLLYYEDLETSSGGLSEEMLALMRDVAERRFLADLASGEKAPVVGLMDGMLEVFGEPRRDPIFEEQFQNYLEALRSLAELQVVIAGYVDKPRADYLVRMLELMAGGEEDVLQRLRARPFGGVTDAMILRGSLPAGARSAVFGIQSRSSKVFTGPLRLYFFYLNVGTEKTPALARVEIPAWVAESPALVDLLHRTLMEQCRITGSKPYPYILHRAHEIAVVGFAEREQISSMIAVELLKRGIDPGEKSYKQVLKDEQGRTRYE